MVEARAKFASEPGVKKSSLHLRAELAAEAEGFDIIGCVHSHTHTDPYPSPTDVAQAPDPDWHYIIVSLKRGAPESRAYRIVGEQISEETIVPL